MCHYTFVLKIGNNYNGALHVRAQAVESDWAAAVCRPRPFIRYVWAGPLGGGGGLRTDGSPGRSLSAAAAGAVLLASFFSFLVEDRNTLLLVFFNRLIDQSRFSD